MQPVMPASIPSFADAAAMVVRALEHALPGSAVWIGHLDSEQGVLRVVASAGEASFGLEPGVEAPLDTSYCQVLAGGGEALVPDAAHSETYAGLPATAGLGVGSFVGAPVALPGDAPLGTVCAFSHAVGAFGQRDLELMRTFAVLLARDLDHQRRQRDTQHVLEELRRQAATDPLTGVANRRMFHAALESAWQRGRDGDDTGVAMVDVNAFKSYNDRFGHDAGDRVLVALARALAAAGSPGDVVGRLGGDEFAVVLTRAASVAPLVWVPRVHRLLSEQLRGSDLGEVTVSIGIGRLENAASPEAALSEADRTMYRGKPDSGIHGVLRATGAVSAA